MNSFNIDNPIATSDSDHVVHRPTDAVDVSVLISLEGAQAEGEPDLVVDLIDLYLEDTPRRLGVISSMFEERDTHSLQHEAHGLKGSSATLGANSTASLCQAIEDTAKVGSWEAVGRLLIELHQEFDRVREIFLEERQKRVTSFNLVLS